MPESHEITCKRSLISLSCGVGEPRNGLAFLASNPRLWSGRLPHVQIQLVDLIRILSQHVRVGINGVKSNDPVFNNIADRQKELDRSRLRISEIPIDDAWCRDHGPTFVRNQVTGEWSGIDWGFNAWGEKYEPWQNDHRLASRLLEQLQIPCIRCPFTGEGGGVETDGNGTLMLTESVWLNPNRNPDIRKSAVTEWMLTHLGAEQIHWFSEGLAEDDTDGHVDMFARFVSSSAILYTEENRPDRLQYRSTQRILEELQGFRTLTGGHYDFIPLPMPEPVYDEEGNVCPATYGNFLLTNDLVLVPQFDQDRGDRQAMGILGECFPSREVVGVDCRLFIQEGGCVHCLTQQQPCFD